MDFTSLEELYKRVLPALKTRKNELIRIGLKYIKEEDIWNYLKEIKWKKTKDLTLSMMVSDILNIDSLKLDEYVKGKMASENRVVYFDIKE